MWLVFFSFSLLCFKKKQIKYPNNYLSTRHRFDSFLSTHSHLLLPTCAASIGRWHDFRHWRVTVTKPLLRHISLNESLRERVAFGSEMGFFDFIVLMLGSLFLFKAFDFAFLVSLFCSIWFPQFFSVQTLICCYEEEARYPFPCCKCSPFSLCKDCILSWVSVVWMQGKVCGSDSNWADLDCAFVCLFVFFFLEKKRFWFMVNVYTLLGFMGFMCLGLWS